MEPQENNIVIPPKTSSKVFLFFLEVLIVFVPIQLFLYFSNLFFDNLLFIPIAIFAILTFFNIALDRNKRSILLGITILVILGSTLLYFTGWYAPFAKIILESLALFWFLKFTLFKALEPISYKYSWVIVVLVLIFLGPAGFLVYANESDIRSKSSVEYFDTDSILINGTLVNVNEIAIEQIQRAINESAEKIKICSIYYSSAKVAECENRINIVIGHNKSNLLGMYIRNGSDSSVVDSVCQTTSDTQNCYRFNAMTVSQCNKVADSSLKDECLLQLAIRKSDPRICDDLLLSNADGVASCKWQAARKARQNQ
jgi:hypothetical protein